MAAVQIPFVEKLQTKFQETYYTVLKYKNEVIFVPSFVFIGLFLRPCCFRKEARNFEDFKLRKRHCMPISNFLKFWP